MLKRSLKDLIKVFFGIYKYIFKLFVSLELNDIIQKHSVGLL